MRPRRISLLDRADGYHEIDHRVGAFVFIGLELYGCANANVRPAAQSVRLRLSLQYSADTFPAPRRQFVGAVVDVPTRYLDRKVGEGNGERCMKQREEFRHAQSQRIASDTRDHDAVVSIERNRTASEDEPAQLLHARRNVPGRLISAIRRQW